MVAPSDPDKWPANNKRNWLVFYNAHGTTLRGAGLIDGKGQKWWELPCKTDKVIYFEVFIYYHWHSKKNEVTPTYRVAVLVSEINLGCLFFPLLISSAGPGRIQRPRSIL